jgi:hypothetical protein
MEVLLKSLDHLVITNLRSKYTPIWLSRMQEYAILLSVPESLILAQLQ